MADRKISDLTALTAPAAGDYLPIVDISEASAANKNKRITIEELLRGAPDGTAAAPSIGFESDPNTGIYSPGADQVAISTGGSGRLFVDAGGVITNSLSSYLAGSAENVFFDAANYRGLTLNTATSAHRPTLSFRNANGAGAIAYIQGDGQALVFGRAGQDYGGHQESLRITSAGLVGVGTSSPGALLSLYAGASAEYFRGGGNGATTRDLVISASTGTNAGDTHTINASGASGRLILSTASSPRMTVTSAGLVGVGTSAPDRLLHLSGADTAYLRLENQDTTGSVDQYVGLIEFEGQDSGGSGVRAQIGAIYEGVSGATAVTIGTSADAGSVTERVRIDRNGRVGIGTTSPAEIFSVAATASATAKAGAFYFATAGNIGDQNSIVIGTAAASTRGVAIAAEKKNADNAHDLVFKNSRTAAEPVEAARIDSSGRLLVGTSSDSGGALFQVNGDRIRVGTAKTPATSGATGTTGEIAWDANYIYVCTATNTWKRSAIATW